MKHILITAILVMALAVVLPGATVSLDYSSNPVSIGDTFTMNVNVSNVFPGGPGDIIFGFGFTPAISDPGKVAFVSAAVNALFLDSSSGGTIIGTALPPLGYGDFTEPLTLATLTFQAIGSGFVDVGVSSDLGDPNQGLVYLVADTANLTTSGTLDVVPEPGSAWMLAPGLAALVLAARRHRYN